MKESEIKIGGIYKLARGRLGDFDHTRLYDKGNFIIVRVLCRTAGGDFVCTTLGADGKHMGPGGGWYGKSEIVVPASCLEPLRQRNRREKVVRFWHKILRRCSLR